MRRSKGEEQAGGAEGRKENKQKERRSRRRGAIEAALIQVIAPQRQEMPQLQQKRKRQLVWLFCYSWLL